MTDDPTARFTALVAARPDDLPLDEACLLVAAHAHPGLDVAAQIQRLDALAAGVADASVEGVCRHLVHGAGLTGDRTTYHDPRNSLLPDVLDRRLGIPLTLAVVAMEVGRRCGVGLVGVGMPGHFLVRAADDPTHFRDLFGGGRRLDVDGCREIFERLETGMPWSEDLIAPAPPRAIVARLLANLASSYRRLGDREGLGWALDLRVRLPGATPREHRELAVVLGAAGRYDAAAQALEATGEERDLHSAQRLRARLN